MTDARVSEIIKRIVDYKWHGEGSYTELERDIEEIEDPTIRKFLGDYLEEARKFLHSSAVKKEVERELLEEWLTKAKPIKISYKEGKYIFKPDSDEV